MPHLEDIKAPESIRKRKLQREASLKSERSTWFDHWRDVSEHLLPRSGRYFITDRNRTGQHLQSKIIDSTPTLAVRVLAAGMMTYLSSPAKPWFNLAAEDPELNKFHPVKVWLEDARNRMLRVFARSNVYRQLHTMYAELGVFGTSVATMLPHPKTLIHLYPSPVGEYSLAQNYSGQIDTLYRRFERSVHEVVTEFGLDAVSEYTKRQYEQGHLDAPVEILHTIEPRKIRDREKLDFLNMPWESCYLEVSGSGDSDMDAPGHGKLLRQGGFWNFPVLAPRWEVNAGDVYGHSPGMMVLPDCKQLYQEQLRKGQAIDYKTDPPKQIPQSMKNLDRELLPGGRIPYDQNTPHGGIRNAFEVTLDLGDLHVDIQDVRQRIRSGFFVDMFLLLSQNPPDGSKITATEAQIRDNEKLTILGPTVGRIHNELHEPLIDRTFERMLIEGMLPPPPEDLEGQELNVEFISLLDQAQKAIGVNNMSRFAAEALSLSGGGKTDALDKLNSDDYLDELGEDLGVPPRIIVSNEKVRELREARNRALAAQQQAEAMALQAKTVKDLAQSPTEGANALTSVASTLGARA